MKGKAVLSGTFVSAWPPAGSHRWSRVSGDAVPYRAFVDLSPLAFLPGILEGVG